MNKLISVNYHLLRACNLKCRFCFATYRDVDGVLRLDDQLRLIDALRAAGTEKLNFVGGEPTLYVHLAKLIRHAAAAGMTTSIVTNGARLDTLLDAAADVLHWVGLSVDSASEDIQAALGRGTGGHVGRARANARRLHRLGITVKLNTVVTRLNIEEDIGDLVREMKPQRWKVFQVLAMGTQNDCVVEELLIKREEFARYVDRHRAQALDPVPEDNDAMLDTYAIIDPIGRFVDCSTGTHRYSRPILQAGVVEAFSDVTFDEAGFVERRGLYEWRPRSPHAPST